jgi:hypothetical protein
VLAEQVSWGWVKTQGAPSHSTFSEDPWKKSRWLGVGWLKRRSPSRSSSCPKAQLPGLVALEPQDSSSKGQKREDGRRELVCGCSWCQKAAGVLQGAPRRSQGGGAMLVLDGSCSVTGTGYPFLLDIFPSVRQELGVI